MPADSPRALRSVDRGPEADELPLPEGVSGTRARILHAGLDLFAERGYHGTSIRDIAAAAGLTSASLYTHFPSKEAILADLVLLGHEVHHHALVEALMSCGTDAREQLRALMRAHVTLHCRYPRLAVVTNTEGVRLDPAAYAPAAALRTASTQIAVEVIGRGIEQGVFHLVDREITQVAISSLGMSASTWFPLHAAHLTPERVGEVYAALVMRLVGADPEEPGAS